MAQASRAVRKYRRTKRENTLLHRYLDVALIERNQARVLAQRLADELETRLKAEAKPKGGLTVTKIDEPQGEIAVNVDGENHQAD